MKRQVAILGPTPQFLRWSVRHSCLLREDTDIESVDQTEKRLRAIRAASIALNQGNIRDGIAIDLTGESPRGFRVADVFTLFGGQQSVEQACHKCPANLVAGYPEKSSLAGCHGWLPRTSDRFDPAILIESVATGDDRRQCYQLFPITRPLWFGFWTAGQLTGRPLELVARLFRRACEQFQVSAVIREFADVLERCVESGLILDAELLPAGFSDGLKWTIHAHCDKCKATRQPASRECPVCHKSGGVHPAIHKKVLGRRPWQDLRVLMGEKNAQCLIEQWQQP